MEYMDSATGQRAKLTFLVEDLSGAGPRVLMQALRAPLIPQRGDTFEGNDTLFVLDRTVTNIEDCTTKWEVTVNYGWPTITGGPFDNPPSDLVRPRLELDSSVVMKRTNIDFNEQPIQIEEYFTGEYDAETGEEIIAPTQGGMVDVPVVLTVLRYQRREPPIDSHGRGIAYKSKLFTGKTNLKDIDGTGAHTWLCTRLGAVTEDGGLSYNVTYEFTFDPERWRATAVYVDPATGQPGGNIYIRDAHTMAGNGIKTFQVVGAADFHQLDLYL
jgi:hypothetical protein